MYGQDGIHLYAYQKVRAAGVWAGGVHLTKHRTEAAVGDVAKLQGECCCGDRVDSVRDADRRLALSLLLDGL